MTLKPVRALHRGLQISPPWWLWCKPCGSALRNKTKHINKVTNECLNARDATCAPHATNEQEAKNTRRQLFQMNINPTCQRAATTHVKKSGDQHSSKHYTQHVIKNPPSYELCSRDRVYLYYNTKDTLQNKDHRDPSSTLWQTQNSNFLRLIWSQWSHDCVQHSHGMSTIYRWAEKGEISPIFR